MHYGIRLSRYKILIITTAQGPESVLVAIRRDTTLVLGTTYLYPTNEYFAVAFATGNITLTLTSDYIQPIAPFHISRLPQVLQQTPRPHLLFKYFNAHHPS